MQRLEKQFLEEVNLLIANRLKPVHELDHGQELLKTICRHLCVSENAKRMRPLLCLYYNLLFREEFHKSLVNIAVTAEFIHAASLLHDDIIDEADKRRGQDSANMRFGNAKTVLAGDFLLTEAFDLLRSLERSLSEKAITVIKEMAVAAMREFNARGKLISSKELSMIAKGKTGILFSWCGYASAICTKEKEAASLLWSLGERIGLIFQIADDLKDFDGDKNLKDSCRDLRNKEPSMPMILAINKIPSLKEEFFKSFSHEVDEQEAHRLKDLIINSGAIKEAEDMINFELQQIMNTLSPYQGTLGKAFIDQWMEVLSLSARAI
jgi:heptaprenyl diphosphate synthase